MNEFSPERINLEFEDVKQHVEISEAKSYEQLFEIIRQSGGLRGSQKFYSPTELIDLITRVREGSLDVSYITRTEGLRDKVKELKGSQSGIENKEIESILEEVEIHGDDFMGEFLTPEILKEEGLLPRYKIRIGDSTVWLSSSYELDAGRAAVIAYVQKKEGIIAHSYYRSNSQGVWRYLPDYKMSVDGEMDWYGKGYGEESVTLPIPLQKILSEIAKEEASVLRLSKNPDFIFAGTAKKFGQNKGSYYREIEASPKRLDGISYMTDGKTPPERIHLSERQSPDFSKLLMSWEQKTSIYGQVTVEVFPSKDGNLKFMFYKDTTGRVWIGGIEDDSEIQSTGLKRSWIEGGDLVTPAFEYKTENTDQTGGYGNDRIRRGPYVDMYTHYIRKIPIIQQYLEQSAVQQSEKLLASTPRIEQHLEISEAKSYEQLFEIIRQSGGLRGSQKFYSPTELIDLITRVREGSLDVSYITRTEGLRDKVKELRKRVTS